MHVHLTPELEKLLHDEVARGHFRSADEAIREGLRLLVEERSWREELRRKIDEGWDQAMSGELVDGAQAFERLRQRIDEPRKTGA